MAYAGDVKAAGGNICGYYYIELAFFQLINSTLALLLLNITIQRCRCIAARFQFFGNFHRAGFGAHKNQHGVNFFGFQNAGERIEFVAPGHRPETLPDGVSGSGFNFNFDDLRIIQVALGNSSYLPRHGCREQCHLAFLRQLFQYPLDIVNETHAQHFICFIKNKGAQFIEFDIAASDVVHYATRCTDNDMHAPVKRPRLHAIVLTAVYRQYMKTFHVGSVGFKRFSNLDGQLPCWCQHEHLRCPVFEIDLRQRR